MASIYPKGQGGSTYRLPSLSFIFSLTSERIKRANVDSEEVKDLCMSIWVNPVADPGGGSRGSGPPPFGPRCRLFNIGPKVGPPPFVNVQEWGVFQIF